MSSYAVLVPVKPLALAKSRLVGISDARRSALAAAFALDTVAVAAATPGVVGVLAVTDDFRFAAELAARGCAVIPDGVTGDLNGSLLQAAHEAVRRWPDAGVAAVCADLPALRATDLAAALRAVPEDRPGFVTDAAGRGTTTYAAALADFAPRFGPDSRDAHLDAGCAEIAGALASLRQDVDDPTDLAQARELGVGPATAAVLANEWVPG
ncbi:2-phospho-L-lactate guanylyltransferase [Nocardioides speluncae]|uniref:2-phospho-L-lactate guanylyltransferase n=1 Tax=Nocardioides speluncae TaxID=2670337 RepID=UPI000D695ABD|nr:2-phospho-L-lactate guanylyltransferase [Nocardioides speluncae]